MNPCPLLPRIFLYLLRLLPRHPDPYFFFFFPKLFTLQYSHFYRISAGLCEMTKTAPGRGRDWKILIKTISPTPPDPEQEEQEEEEEEDRNRFPSTERTIVEGEKKRVESLVTALYDFAFYSWRQVAWDLHQNRKFSGKREKEPAENIPLYNSYNQIVLHARTKPTEKGGVLKTFSIIELSWCELIRIISPVDDESNGNNLIEKRKIRFNHYIEYFSSNVFLFCSFFFFLIDSITHATIARTTSRG